jgi:hypothetical protein
MSSWKLLNMAQNQALVEISDKRLSVNINNRSKLSE